MSPSPPSRPAGWRTLAALLWALLAVPAAAEVRLDVGGAVEPSGDGLMVRVDVANHGDSAATRVDVEGDLFGHYAEGSLPAGVRAGASASLWLHFPVPPPRPGVHALALHLRYPVPGSSEGASQRAYLLLGLAARPEPVVRLAAAPATFETSGALQVAVESADGRPHSVRLRVLAPRGVNVLQDPVLDVPAAGAAVARVPLIRTGPSRKDRHGLVVLAAATTEGVESTAAITTVVELVPHAPWLPRVRVLMTVAAALLLAAAVGVEVWARWRT